MLLPIEIIEKVRAASPFRERNILSLLCRRFRSHPWPRGDLPPLDAFEFLKKVPAIVPTLANEKARVILPVTISKREQRKVDGVRWDFIPLETTKPLRRKEITLSRTFMRDGFIIQEVTVTEYGLGNDGQWTARHLNKIRRDRQGAWQCLKGR
jgi:hypothetical protein